MKYIHKPTMVEAIQFTGNNYDELEEFIPKEHWEFNPSTKSSLMVKNRNGWLDIYVGDYIIKKDGDCWVCTPDVFEKSYKVKK